jgi:hypothetical protein
MAKARAKSIRQTSPKRIESTKTKRLLRIDPIFAAIDKHRNLLKECDRLFAVIDRNQKTLKKQNDRRLSSLRRQYERTLRAERTAGMRMAKIKPKTLAGAAALVAYTRADIKLGIGPKWHLVALATVATALDDIEHDLSRSESTGI